MPAKVRGAPSTFAGGLASAADAQGWERCRPQELTTMGSTAPGQTFPVSCSPCSVLGCALDAAGWLGLLTRHNPVHPAEEPISHFTLPVKKRAVFSPSKGDGSGVTAHYAGS